MESLEICSAVERGYMRPRASRTIWASPRSACRSLQLEKAFRRREWWPAVRCGNGQEWSGGRTVSGGDSAWRIQPDPK
jgi:hypothetical protein